MAFTCENVPALTQKVADQQAEVSNATFQRDRRKAEMLRKGQTWEGSTQQIALDAKIAEELADLAVAEAELAEAVADCG